MGEGGANQHWHYGMRLTCTMSSSKPPYVHEPFVGEMARSIQGKTNEFFPTKKYFSIPFSQVNLYNFLLLFITKFHVAFLLIVGKPFDVNGTH
jgi:hypothetical protein